MRVLFTAWAWPSHYFPLVPLAWALRAAGHEVRMAGQPALLPTMRDSGLPCTAVGRDYDVVAHYRRETERVAIETPSADEYEAILAGRPTSKPSRRSRLALYAHLADAMVDDLLALARSWRPDVIVYDPLTHAGPLVARLVGVPAVRSLFGPDITYFTRAGGEEWTALLDRLGVDGEVDLIGDASLDPCPPGIQVDPATAPTRRIPMRFVPYHGLAEVPRWLDAPAGRERICLTWGTSTDRLLGRDGFVPDDVLLGCVKLADERDAELVVAITTGQRDMLDDLPAHVRVVESTPLDALLGTCTALVHQGGPGTMLTALRYGLPQLSVTNLVDQAANAYKLANAGAGRTLPAARMTATEVLAAGHDLLDDPGYRAAACRLRDQMHAMPTPAETVAEIRSL